MVTGEPTVAFSENVTVTALLLEVMVADPGFVGRVNDTEAWPREVVVTGFAEKLPFAVPSLKVTACPGTAFPYASLSFTTSAAGKVEPTGPVCAPPDTSAIVLGGPAVAIAEKEVAA
jgi:hypothetical protein